MWISTAALISTLWSAQRQTKSSTSSSAGGVDTYGSRDGDDAEYGDSGSVVWIPIRNPISSSRLANIHAYRAGVSTSCDLASRSAAAHSLSCISEECTGFRNTGLGTAFTFGMRWTNLAHMFANRAAKFVGTEENKGAQAKRRGNWSNGGFVATSRISKGTRILLEIWGGPRDDLGMINLCHPAITLHLRCLLYLRCTLHLDCIHGRKSQLMIGRRIMSVYYNWP